MNSEAIIIRPELLTLTTEQLKVLMPFLVLFAGTMGTLLLGTVRVIAPKWPVLILSLLSCLASLYFFGNLSSQESVYLFNQTMIVDKFSVFFGIVFLLAGVFTCLISTHYLDKENLQYPEYYMLILFSVFGMMLMVSSLDLIVFFIALELMSLAVYVLVGFRRSDRRSNEAALKYFILGSVASAVLLYGTALLYGVSGSTQITKIFQYAYSQTGSISPVYVMGAGLVVAGFLFKVAAVPFHMWMPDVYEGAPVPVTGFMTTGLKAAAFATFLRVFIYLYGAEAADFHQAMHNVLRVAAVLTMVVGNVVALTQTNLKRLLGYSSIAHTGYLLLGIISGSANAQGNAPLVIYIVSYVIMNLGAFAILSVLSHRDDGGLNLHDLSGLAKKRPGLAFGMAVFLLSMAGIPPTAGFMAKYLLFYSAIQAGETILVIIGVLCSAVSVYYYLRVIVYMYMRDPSDLTVEPRMTIPTALAVTAMVLLTLQVGIMPQQMVTVAKNAITHI